MSGLEARLYAGITRLVLPAHLRRYRPQMTSTFLQARRAAALENGLRGGARTWLRELRELTRIGIAERRAPKPFRSPSPTSVPPATGPSVVGSPPPKERLPMTLFDTLRHAGRTLRRHPAYAVAFVVTLGLGIGANTAIFSVIQAVLLSPLPYPDADRIVYLRQPMEIAGSRNMTFSIPEIEDFRTQARTIDAVVDYSSATVVVLGEDQPHRVRVGIVGSQFFDLLGLRPHHGRVFGQSDNVPTAEPVAVLTHEYWRQRYGADPGVIGATLRIHNQAPITIVGVLEPGFHYSGTDGIYVNTASSAHHAGASMQTSRTHRMTQVYARMGPDVSIEEARAELEGLVAQFHQSYPEAYREDWGFGFAVDLWREELTRQARPVLLVLAGTAGLVLLIACANVINLTLTSLVRRERELAIRAALGAGRGRLRAQVLAESTLLSAAGAAVGLAVAALVLGTLVGYAQRFTMRAMEIEIDASVLAFSFAVATLVSLLVSWAPRLRPFNELGVVLGNGGASTLGAPRRRLQRGLVVAQISLSFFLLVAVGLLVRTLDNLTSIDPGLDVEHVLALEIPATVIRPGDELSAFHREVLERVQAHPEVHAAALTMTAPFTSQGDFRPRYLAIDGRAIEGVDAAGAMSWNVGTPDYFDAVGMQLVAGRSFEPSDDRGTAPVAIVNQTFVDRFFPDREPVGLSFTWALQPGRNERTVTIVGVVADSRLFGLVEEPVPTIFEPVAQAPFPPTVLVVRAAEPTRLAPEFISTVHQLEPRQPVENVRTLESIRAETVAPHRLNVALFGSIALLAIVLATVGLAAVLAFTVSQRMREFSIRLALGADASEVFGIVLRQGLTLAGLGLLTGGVAAWWASRLMRGMLFEVEPTDPLTFVAVAAGVLTVTLAASALPALRATASDPVTALRDH